MALPGAGRLLGNGWFARENELDLHGQSRDAHEVGLVHSPLGSKIILPRV